MPDDATVHARREHVPWWRVKVSPLRQAAGALALVVAAGILYVIYGLGLSFFAVTSISMTPTLQMADRIAAFPAREYHRGDIVVLRDPTEEHGYIVKRVIALPGDTIEVRGGAVLINGVYASEPYRPEPIDYVVPPYSVGEGQIWVMGDNANWSTDSHNWAAAFAEAESVVPGTVPMGAIVGKVHYVYLPPKRIGPVRSYPLRRVLGL